jgi:hypothetical protein
MQRVHPPAPTRTGCGKRRADRANGVTHRRMAQRQGGLVMLLREQPQHAAREVLPRAREQRSGQRRRLLPLRTERSSEHARISGAPASAAPCWRCLHGETFVGRGLSGCGHGAIGSSSSSESRSSARASSRLAYDFRYTSNPSRHLASCAVGSATSAPLRRPRPR